MNPLHPLDDFLQRATNDQRLNPFHISLYIAIFQQWSADGAHMPISVTRQQLMQTSKISSISTYHKHISTLHHYGYIRYKPSYHPHEGSLIDLIFSGTCSNNEQVQEATCSINEQVREATCSINEQVQEVTCSINEQVQEVTCSNNEQVQEATCSINEQVQGATCSINEQVQKTKNNPITRPNIMKSAYNPIDQPPIFATEPVRQTNMSIKRTCKKSPIYNNNILDIYNIENIGEVVPKVIQVPEVVPKVVPLQPPELSQVTAFFSAQNRPKIEAEKFFNYYQSNGWRVGKNPMKNWQAAARNWMLNMNQFTPSTGTSAPSPGILQAPPIKDYSEPL